VVPVPRPAYVKCDPEPAALLDLPCPTLAVHPSCHHQGQCKNAGKTLLAAVPAGSQCVHLFEINDEVRGRGGGGGP
jgi:hypothetical protein